MEMYEKRGWIRNGRIRLRFGKGWVEYVKKLKSSLQAYLFIGPFVILSAVFMVWPILNGFITSLYNTKWAASIFVGLENYRKVFSDNLYLLSIKNSLLLVAIVVPLIILLGIWISGSIFDKARFYVSSVRVCLYVPVIASMVVMSLIWRFLLDSQSGLVKYFSMKTGMGAVDLLSDKTWAMALVVLIMLTMSIGQAVLLYVADMLAIPGELLEACRIDGGTRWDLFRRILIPLTLPTTIFIFITQTSEALKVFVVIQLVTKGGPNHSTTTMMYLLYEEAFEKSNNGMACALGVVMFLISLILVTLRFVAERRMEE